MKKPRRGECRGWLITERWLSTADHQAIRYQWSSTTTVCCAFTCGNVTKGKSATDADVLKQPFLDFHETHHPT